MESRQNRYLNIKLKVFLLLCSCSHVLWFEKEQKDDSLLRRASAYYNQGNDHPESSFFAVMPFTTKSTTTEAGEYNGVLHTTCQAYRNLPNKRFLRIDPSKPGGFPETQFTHYIQNGIINPLIHSGFSKENITGLCSSHISVNHPITFNSPSNSFTNVTVELPKKGQFGATYATILRRLFSSDCQRGLPPSIDGKPTFIGLQNGDKDIPNQHRYKCFSVGSTPSGIFHIHNFEYTKWLVWVPKNNAATYTVPPWEERDPIPVFRGTVHGLDLYFRSLVNRNKKEKKNQTIPEIFDQMYDGIMASGSHHLRMPLAKFSLDHPDLLNARTKVKWGARSFISKLLNITTEEVGTYMPPDEPIDRKDYYTKYQVSLVMGGIGAAFRTADHLALGSAVILHDFPFKEWFTPYMTPFVNYIPLAQDISNLTETLRWVRDHPDKVKEIAANGRLFWEQYLSYDMMEEFFYELTYRLAENRIYDGIDTLDVPPSLLMKPYDTSWLTQKGQPGRSNGIRTDGRAYHLLHPQ